MTCEWCRGPIALLDSKFSRFYPHWHTRCWNEATEQHRKYIEEMDNLEGFTSHHAPPVRSRPALPDEPGPKPNWSEVIQDMPNATNNLPPRDVVEFPPNTPATVALKYGQGKIISGQYGERVMFTLTDGRIMFLAPEVAGQIENPRHQCARVVHDHQTRCGPERCTRLPGHRASRGRATQRDSGARGAGHRDLETI